MSHVDEDGSGAAGAASLALALDDAFRNAGSVTIRRGAAARDADATAVRSDMAVESGKGWSKVSTTANS
jgi:hypothetical protein